MDHILERLLDFLQPRYFTIQGFVGERLVAFSESNTLVEIKEPEDSSDCLLVCRQQDTGHEMRIPLYSIESTSSETVFTFVDARARWVFTAC